MAPDSLEPYPNNAKKHSGDQIQKVMASLQEFGFVNPILCDGKKGIIAGHCRVLAAQKMGLEKVPVIEVKHLTKAQKRAYILADNRLAELGEWDFGLVSSELLDLSNLNFNIQLTGFDDGFISHGDVDIIEKDDLGKSGTIDGHVYSSDAVFFRLGDVTAFVKFKDKKETDKVRSFIKKILDNNPNVIDVNNISKKIVRLIIDNEDLFS